MFGYLGRKADDQFLYLAVSFILFFVSWREVVLFYNCCKIEHKYTCCLFYLKQKECLTLNNSGQIIFCIGTQ